jgi:hypothetical protein
MAKLKEALRVTKVLKNPLFPVLLLLVFGVPIGPLLAGWASSFSQEPKARAQAEPGHGAFRVLSNQERQRIPEGERQLLTLKENVLLVDPGDETAARKYYNLEIAGKFPSLYKNQCLATNLLGCSLPDMLAYFGYGPLLPADLQRLPPETLMDYGSLLRAVSNPQAFQGFPVIQKDELLVTRFFAPKIISVKQLPTNEFGWRKVLYFRARQSSGAARDGLAEFYLLFNFGSGADPKFPEGKDAAQIQAMLTPKYPSGNHFSAYFFVFNTLSGQCPEANSQGQIVFKTCERGQIGLHLTASFDANFLPQKNYYVPTACAQCHGTSGNGSQNARINYLDTDHWYDKVQRPGGDFSQVEKNDVLVGAGGRAMRTIYQLNARIRTQNAAIAEDSFQTRATTKWLDLHADCKDQPVECADRHFEPLSRGFKKPGSDTVWSSAKEADRSLLPLLNQNCFRCHSSFKFHVFEKKTVYDQKGLLSFKLNNRSMPPDRTLDQALLDEMKTRLGQLTEP